MSVGPGVSVVIPSYRGAAALAETLASLDAQTVDHARFEAVVVLNGPTAADTEPFNALRERLHGTDIRMLVNAEAGASLAWNRGIQEARREWLTFLDDDDSVTPGYLEELLQLARPGIVPLGRIDDVDASGVIETDTALNRRIDAYAGDEVPATKLPQALGFNAAKLLPTAWAREATYPVDLSNGQDVVFFGGISQRHDITFAVTTSDADARYRRGVASDSMSRQAPTPAFAVDDRLKVIAALNDARASDGRRATEIVDHLIEAQVYLISRYLVERPDLHGDVVNRVRRQRFASFPYQTLNRGVATELVLMSDDGSLRNQAVRLALLVARRRTPIDVLVVTTDAHRTGRFFDRFWDHGVWRHRRGHTWLLEKPRGQWEAESLCADAASVGLGIGDQKMVHRYRRVRSLVPNVEVERLARSLSETATN